MKIWDINDSIVTLYFSEFIYTLVLGISTFSKDFKREIIEIFDSDDFFKCNVDTLKIWSKIIDKFLDVTKADIVSEHFEKYFNKFKFYITFLKQKYWKLTLN